MLTKRKYFRDNTLHLLNLAITCLLHYPRRHNVTALLWFSVTRIRL